MADDTTAAGHITNYAQNENGLVWNLAGLADHIGSDAWAALLASMRQVAACVFAATLRRVQQVQAQMDLPPRWEPGSGSTQGATAGARQPAARPWLLLCDGCTSDSSGHRRVRRCRRRWWPPTPPAPTTTTRIFCPVPIAAP